MYNCTVNCTFWCIFLKKGFPTWLLSSSKLALIGFSLSSELRPVKNVSKDWHLRGGCLERDPGFLRFSLEWAKAGFFTKCFTYFGVFFFLSPLTQCLYLLVELLAPILETYSKTQGNILRVLSIQLWACDLSHALDNGGENIELCYIKWKRVIAKC